MKMQASDQVEVSERSRRVRRARLAGVVGISLAALFHAGASFARSPFGYADSHRDPGALIEENVEALGLDQEALAAIRSIVAESKPKGDALHAKLEELHDGMKALLDRDAPDEAALMQQVEAIGAAEIEMHKHRLATMLAIRQRLTPEQREKLVEIRDESRGRWKHALRDACEADVKALCADADDRSSRNRCLVENEDKLSPECADAIAKLHSEHHGGCKHAKLGCAEGCCAKCGELGAGEGCCAKCGEPGSGAGCCKRHGAAGSGESCSERKRD